METFRLAALSKMSAPVAAEVTRLILSWANCGQLKPPTPKMRLEETLALTPSLSPRRERPELCARIAPLNLFVGGRARHSVRAVLEQPGKRRAQSDAPYLGSWAGGSMHSSREFSRPLGVPLLS